MMSGEEVCDSRIVPGECCLGLRRIDDWTDDLLSMNCGHFIEPF